MTIKEQKEEAHSSSNMIDYYIAQALEKHPPSEKTYFFWLCYLRIIESQTAIVKDIVKTAKESKTIYIDGKILEEPLL